MKALRKILVVDDDPVVGSSLGRVLGMKGYAVIEARDGGEALDKLSREDYDMVYADIRMPGMNGIELARVLKQNRPWLPVVIVTGYGTESHEAAAKEIGVEAFLRKPLSPEMIEESVERVMLDPEIAAIEAMFAKAPAAEPEPVAETAPEAETGVAHTARNVALFFAAPFVALAYVLAAPFVGFALLGWMGWKALKK